MNQAASKPNPFALVAGPAHTIDPDSAGQMADLLDALTAATKFGYPECDPNHRRLTSDPPNTAHVWQH